jgi:hypothetical protein
MILKCYAKSIQKTRITRDTHNRYVDCIKNENGGVSFFIGPADIMRSVISECGCTSIICQDVKIADNKDTVIYVGEEKIKMAEIIPFDICLFRRGERYDIPMKVLIPLMSEIGQEDVFLPMDFPLDKYLVKKTPNSFWN